MKTRTLFISIPLIAVVCGCVHHHVSETQDRLPPKPTAGARAFYVTPKQPVAAARPVAVESPIAATIPRPQQDPAPLVLQLAQSLTITRYATAQVIPDEAATRYIMSIVPAAKGAKSVTVKGFTDATGDRDKNISLAIARADRVRSMLVANGVAASKVRVMYCSTCYVASNESEDGRRRNRRVEVALRGAEMQRSAGTEAVIVAMN
jgi:outer membrane protein OmpA-like peptidoglycan-associated protein